MAEIKSILSDPEKKKKLKFLLTLLGLLFIILVISVLITRLILGPTEEKNFNYNENESLITNVENNSTNDTKEAQLNLRDHNPDISNALEKKSDSKLSSITKEPLRAYRPITKIKPFVTKHTEKKPCPTTAKKAIVHSKPKTVTKKHTAISKDEYFDELVVNRKNTPQREYIDPNSDKVIISGNGSKTTYSATSSSKSSQGTFLHKLKKGFYIKVGTYQNPSSAIKKVKKTGLHYKLIKNNKGLTQIFVGKFNTRSSARVHLTNIQKITSDAYIMEQK